MKADVCAKLILLGGVLAAPCACSRGYDPFHPDTSHCEGIWGIDNENYRRADEPPIVRRLEVYATHMEYCPGQGRWGAQGEWKNGGFWCEAKDGSGIIEAVKPLDPYEVELHLDAFYPAKSEVVVLYKIRGDDEEMSRIAAKYPPPIVYPPPQGVMVSGMSEYQLMTLPWKPDRIMRAEGDDRSADAAIYCYHSDNANLAELRVTVKDHRVIAVSGGNG